MNRVQRNKIPDANSIEKQKDIILHYWDLINKQQPVNLISRFSSDIEDPKVV